MNESHLKSAAYTLAEATPKHLDQPTTPPIHWDLEGDVLRVLLADGREVRAPLADLQPKPTPRAPKVSSFDPPKSEREVIPPKAGSINLSNGDGDKETTLARPKKSPSTPANRTFSRKNK